MQGPLDSDGKVDRRATYRLADRLLTPERVGDLLAGLMERQAAKNEDHTTRLSALRAKISDTALCYFNALRELGGARRIVEDEVRDRAARYGTQRRRVDPKDSPFADRTIKEPMEITSRVSTDDVAQAKQRLDTVFGRNADPVDVALATNMISVGLDILRLGLMVVQGQPKTAAEYIQATSRIGRDDNRPGLVVVVLNLHKPRDRTHFEQFGNFHRSFYRAVEATSVTPWASRALDRALAAVVVSAARHVDPSLTPDIAVKELRTDPLSAPRCAMRLWRARRRMRSQAAGRLSRRWWTGFWMPGSRLQTCRRPAAMRLGTRRRRIRTGCSTCRSPPRLPT